MSVVSDPLNVIPDHIYQQRQTRHRGGTNLKRRESFVPIECPTCGESRWLALPNARRALKENRPCISCSSREKYRAVIARYGNKIKEKILAAIVARPLNRIERRVNDLIDEAIEPLDLSFASQVIVEPFVLDFAIYYQGRIVGVIEVNGWHHNTYRAERDSRVQVLFEQQILFVDAQEVKAQPLTVKAQITDYLKELDYATHQKH